MVQPLFRNSGALTVVAAAVLYLLGLWHFHTLEKQLDVKILLVGERVEAISARLVGRGPEGWHKADMRTWVDELQSLNKDLVLPAVRNQHDRFLPAKATP